MQSPRICLARWTQYSDSVRPSRDSQLGSVTACGGGATQMLIVISTSTTQSDECNNGFLRCLPAWARSPRVGPVLAVRTPQSSGGGESVRRSCTIDFPQIGAYFINSGGMKGCRFLQRPDVHSLHKYTSKTSVNLVTLCEDGCASPTQRLAMPVVLAYGRKLSWARCRQGAMNGLIDYNECVRSRYIRMKSRV